MEIKELLEPSKLFKSSVKPTHTQNVDDYYEKLVSISKLDVELNRATNKNIRIKNSKIKDQEKVLGRKKLLKSFLIFITVVLLIVAIFTGISLFNEDYKEALGWMIPTTIVSLGLGILIIVLIVKKLNPSIKNIDEIIRKLTDERNALIQEAIAQMAPLNALFDWNIPTKLFTKTLPLIQLDRFFDESRYQMLHEKYNYNGNPETNISTVFVQSGTILGNPFLIEKNYVQDMHNVTYTGHLTITWTTTYHDSNGHVRTQTHTQTLTASVHKPAPYYYYDTWLVYGNDAAGNLSFSRAPSNINNMNDKQIEKLVKSFDSKLDKITQKQIGKGSDFQRLGNNEFEALFNALDRDNNIEFRLLFTPLAQKNMIDLIKSKEPYGDDFHFVKRKNLNYIKSAHSQNIDFEADPAIFNHFYDYDESKKFFMDYNDNYMQSLYFDLAPIMSVPLYQQHAAKEYIYKETFKRKISEMETEALANSYKSEIFSPDEAITDSILKTRLISVDGKTEKNEVHAYAFTAVKHVDFVSTLGGDGKFHQVPVEWLEYIPVEKKSEIFTQICSISDKSCDNISGVGKVHIQETGEFLSKDRIIFKRGLVSYRDESFKGKSFIWNELKV